MSYDFSGDSPIYLQLIRMIRLRIVTGELESGSRMASVRDQALEYGVNPNTVQRALGELEREGLVHAQRTAGRFVTTQEDLIEKTREDIAQAQIEAFVGQMRSIGYQPEQVASLITEKWRKQHGSN